MKKQINLIPTEMTVPVKMVVLSKTLYKIATIGTIFLILLTLTLISGLVYLNIQYKNTVTSVETLKAKIADLQKNEQKLILAKDKLSKIAYIRSINSVDNEITNFQDFANSVTSASASAFTEISIDPVKSETSLSFQNTEELSSALGVLKNLTKFKSIILSSLGFSGNSGYLVSLIFKN